ncbi:MAG: GFA family protein [Sphingopyxis sp.]
MTEEFKGGCRCGQLRYRIAQDGPLLNYICHCLDCQKSTASAFADQLIVAVDALAVEGRSITVEFPRPTGGVSTLHHCPDCLSRVYNLNSVRPAIAIVRAGTLDDPSILEPFAHLWVKRKRRWIAIPDGVAIFDENPDPAEFMALARARRG